MPGAGFLYALLYLALFALIAGLIFWLVRKYCPEPPRSAVEMIMTIGIVVVVILWLISLLVSLPPPGGHFPPWRN